MSLSQVSTLSELLSNSFATAGSSRSLPSNCNVGPGGRQLHGRAVTHDRPRTIYSN